MIFGLRSSSRFGSENSANIMDGNVQQVQYAARSEKSVQAMERLMASSMESTMTKMPPRETGEIRHTYRDRSVMLISCDGEDYVLKLAEAQQSRMIKALIDGEDPMDAVLLSGISKQVLDKVVEYWRRHAGSHVDEKLRIWDETFFMALDKELRFKLLLAADYLKADELLDATSQLVADTIKDMEVEEVRKYLRIRDDGSALN